MNKIKEMTAFFLSPFKEQWKNKRVKENSYYLKKLRNAKVKENTVLLESYHAVSMTGNIYAIFSQLVTEKPDYEFYWSVKNTKDPMIKEIKNIFGSRNIHFVKYESRAYYSLLASCKYLLNDTSFMPYFTKKSEQVYINSWHGTPLKTLGKDIKNANRSAHKNIQRNLLHADHIIMPNKFTADKLINAYDLNDIYPGKVHLTGNARVDLTLKSDVTNIKRKYNLPLDKEVVLYAPTWKKTIAQTTIDDIENIIEEVSEIQNVLGDSYIVLLKSHYFIYDYFCKNGFEKKIVPNWIETNELLATVSLLITDYSSIFFDFLPLKRPIYFYMPDAKEYARDRGFYLDLGTLPGRLVETKQELLETLVEDKKKYLNDYQVQINDYIEKFCYLDDGYATSRVINNIFNNNNEAEILSYKSNKQLLLFYCGGFYNNGITNSVINLTEKIDYEKYDVIFIDLDRMTKEKNDNIARVDSRVHFIYLFGRMNRTVYDSIQQNIFFRQSYNSKYLNKKKLQNNFKLEFQRAVGNLKPDTVIDFGGYNKFFTALFGFSNVEKKVIYLQSIMMGEYDKKIGGKYKHRWNLKITFSLYQLFDKVISVSESANEENKKDLSVYVDNPDEKMTFVNNCINGEDIVEKAELGKLLNKGNPLYSMYTDENYAVYQETINEFGVLELKGFRKPAKQNKNFVTVGRLSPEKNHVKLLEAFKQLSQENSDCYLYIIGDGPLRKEIQNKIEILDLNEKVIMMGHIENPSLFLKECDCFILPSTHEGQGLSLIEAMIIGLPVIGTDVPGIKSVLAGSNGYLAKESVEGIHDALLAFVNGEISPSYFDYERYNDEAIAAFYRNVV